MKYDRVVLTAFLLIMNKQTFIGFKIERENCHHDHVPFERNRTLLLFIINILLLLLLYYYLIFFP